MRTFKSRTSPLFVTLVAIELLALMLAFWFHAYWLGALFIVICTNEATRLVQTEYKLHNNGTLEIVRGKLQRPITIELSDIATAKQRYNIIMGGSALSPYGVQITLTSGKTYFVSPLDCEAFMARLAK